MPHEKFDDLNTRAPSNGLRLHRIGWALCGALSANRHFSRPVRNAHKAPKAFGVRPGKLLPKQLATADLSQIYKICEKARLKRD